MSENIINYIERAEEREMERVKKCAEYADGRCIRFSYEIDNNDIRYRGIDIEDFEKACLASRIELIDELKDSESVNYEDVIARFVANLEFRLFDGLYMDDLEDLIEESDKQLLKEEAIC